MRLFWHLTKRALQRQLTYRAATLAGLATNFFFGILRASVMVALYGGRIQVEGMTLRDAVTYTGLTQSMIAFLSLFGWYEVMNSVSTGEIASDLLKPMSFYRFWLAQDLGRAIMQLVLRGLPIMGVYALAFRISTPDTVQQWSLFLAALFFSWWVSYRFDRKEITASELIGRLSACYRIQDLEVREPDIEDTVRRIYEEGLLDGGRKTNDDGRKTADDRRQTADS